MIDCHEFWILKSKLEDLKFKARGCGICASEIYFSIFLENKEGKKTEVTLSLILRFNLRLGGYSIWSVSTSLGRKESVGIPNIHKIALEDRIKPIENFQGFYPLKSCPPSNSDSHLSLLSQNPKAPLVAPELKLVTMRWLARRTSPRLKRERLPICPQVGVKARCLSHWFGSWRVWVSSKSRA